MRRPLATLLAIAASALAGVAGAAEIHQYELDNGMEVLVSEDHRAPVVASMVWYRVGSIDEHRGITGVSHVLEHMMFKGTEAYGPGEYAEIIARHGGRANAFTTRGYTAYYQQIAAEHLELVLRLEADRMTNLLLAKKSFRRELGVVREERRQRVTDNPRALLWERLRAMAFISSTTRIPVIGWPADLATMRLEEVVGWYRSWYAPNNAALVVVGDVRAEHVLELARKYFGEKEPEPLPPRPALSRIEPRGVKHVEIHASAKLPYLAMAWRVPSLTTAEDVEDVYALSVLTAILDGGRSARFSAIIVRGRGIAAGAGASYAPWARTDVLLRISGTPAKGHTVADLKAAFRRAIDRLKAGEIGEAELARVKTNVRASRVFQQDSLLSQAMRIGVLEMIGVGQDAYAAWLEGIQQVTAEDIQRVARQYLTDRRLTVARLVPEGVQVGDSSTPSRAQQPSEREHADVE